MHKDKIAQWREHFPIVNQCVYLDHAFAGPLSRDAADAVQRATEAHLLGASRTFDGLMSECENVRVAFASFIGTRHEEVAILNTTSAAISAVANALEWKPGQSVVVPSVEYLSNLYPWLNLQRSGVRVRRVPVRNGRISVDDMQAACDRHTRVMAISWVQFTNGFRADIEALGEFCRMRGILFVVDGNHAAGVLNIRLADLPIDVFVTQSFKWLMGPYNVSWLYVRGDLIEQMRPVAVGPLSTAPNPSFIQRDFEPRSDAARFETGVPNYAGIIGVGASLALLENVGVAEIEARALDHSDYLAEGLSSRGYTVLSPRDRLGERSSILLFRHPEAASSPLPSYPASTGTTGNDDPVQARGLDRRGHDPWHAALLRRLIDANIIVGMREGSIRVSPHFYNTTEELDSFLEALP